MNQGVLLEGEPTTTIGTQDKLQESYQYNTMLPIVPIVLSSTTFHDDGDNDAVAALADPPSSPVRGRVSALE